MSNTILEAKTAAEDVFVEIRHIPATLSALGLAGAENVNIYIVNGSNSATPLVDASGAAQTLSAAIPMLAINAPCKLKLSKPITASAVSLHKSDSTTVY